VSNFLYLERPLHPNYFPNFTIPEESRETFLFSIDGAIQAVADTAVSGIISQKEIMDVRLGYAKPPKKMKIENMEDLLKLVAMMVEL